MKPVLMVRDSAGDYQVASSEEILRAADDVIKSRFKRGEAITSPKESFDLFNQKLALREREIFAVLFLDERHRILAYEELFLGTINAANVYPRVILQKALGYNAAAIIVAHNHPSGVAEPSENDKRITDRLISILTLVDVQLIDHIVVGASGCVSFAERGFM